jgi:hypothetical protein
MSAPDLDALYAEAVDQAVADDYVRRHHRAEPVADPSGMLLPAEPVPADADEDARFAAAMETCFPARVR